MRRLLALPLLGAILCGGCASHRHRNFDYEAEIKAAKLPEFLVGPASVLLTNASDMSARITVEEPGKSNKVAVVTGQLLIQGNRLLYAQKAGDRTFIWDAQLRAGYVLSDALQGYAPISSAVRVTNIFTTSEIAGGSGGTQVNGHAGHEAEITVASDDGSMAVFTVWRATDLNGFPVRIQSKNAVPPFTVNLFDVRPDKLAPKLFEPPDGFTAYPTAETMAGELFARKAKAKSSTVTGDYIEPPSKTSYTK